MPSTSRPSLLFQVIDLKSARVNSAAFALTCVIGVLLPVARSTTCTSAGADGVLITAAPRRPSAETDSIRPDQSPLASLLTAPLATDTRKTPLRARAFAPKRIDWPSAAQLYCPMAPLNDDDTWRGSPPPSAGTTQSLSSASSQVLSLGARYDSTLPSGDHCTFCSGASLRVTVVTAPLATSTTAISPRFWPLRVFSRPRLMATLRPSGATRKLSISSVSS